MVLFVYLRFRQTDVSIQMDENPCFGCVGWDSAQLVPEPHAVGRTSLQSVYPPQWESDYVEHNSGCGTFGLRRQFSEIDKKFKDIDHFAQASISSALPLNHLSYRGSHCLVYKANLLTYKIRMSDKGIRIFFYGEHLFLMRSPELFSRPCISQYTTPESCPFPSMWCTFHYVFACHQQMEGIQLRFAHLCYESGFDVSDNVEMFAVNEKDIPRICDCRI